MKMKVAEMKMIHFQNGIVIDVLDRKQEMKVAGIEMIHFRQWK